MHPPIITLTTDFGASGPYVAAMKGVILGINPAALLVDVSHEIGPQNIRDGALCLASVAPYFPDGTIHVAVVDPGVGTRRRLLAVRMHEQIFLAPDNGILTWAAREAHTIERIELTESSYWRKHISATFHGRDILAPVAAFLSLGVVPINFGKPVDDWVQIPWPTPQSIAGGLEGEVLTIDRFGNLITSISESDLLAGGRNVARVVCGNMAVGALATTYADARAGDPVALIGSHGLLEIAVRNGSAVARLGCAVGSPVAVHWSAPKP